MYLLEGVSLLPGWLSGGLALLWPIFHGVFCSNNQLIFHQLSQDGVCGRGGGGPRGEFGSIGITLQVSYTGSPHRDACAAPTEMVWPIDFCGIFRTLWGIFRDCAWVDEPEGETAADCRAQISRTLALRVDHGSLS